MKTLLILLLSAAGCFAQPLLVTDPAFRAQQTAAAIPNGNTNGIVAYWTLNETGDPRLDSSGAGRSLSKASAMEVGYAAAKFSNGAYFDKDSAKALTLPDEDAFSAVNNSMTFAMWCMVPVTNDAEMVLISKDANSSGAREYALDWYHVQNCFVFNIRTNASSTFATAKSTTNGIPTNAFCFVVGQIDHTNHIVKVRYGADTTLYGWGSQPTLNGLGTNTTAVFQIGRLATSVLPLRGVVDELGVWSRLLTDAEITNLWNGGAGKTWPLTP